MLLHSYNLYSYNSFNRWETVFWSTSLFTVLSSCNEVHFSIGDLIKRYNANIVILHFIWYACVRSIFAPFCYVCKSTVLVNHIIPARIIESSSNGKYIFFSKGEIKTKSNTWYYDLAEEQLDWVLFCISQAATHHTGSVRSKSVKGNTYSKGIVCVCVCVWTAQCVYYLVKFKFAVCMMSPVSFSKWGCQ